MASFFTWILTTKRKSFFSLVLSSYQNSGAYRQKLIVSEFYFFFQALKDFFRDCFNCALSLNDMDFFVS